jgi:hypothetical protein
MLPILGSAGHETDTQKFVLTFARPDTDGNNLTAFLGYYRSGVEFLQMLKARPNKQTCRGGPLIDAIMGRGEAHWTAFPPLLAYACFD